jgi:hypothetical protein
MTYVCKNEVGSECQESAVEDVVMFMDDSGRRLNHPKGIAVGTAVVNRNALATRPEFMEKTQRYVALIGIVAVTNVCAKWRDRVEQRR